MTGTSESSFIRALEECICSARKGTVDQFTLSFFFFVVSLLLERFFFPIIIIVMFGSLCSQQQSILPLLVAHLKSGSSVNIKLLLLKAWIG